MSSLNIGGRYGKRKEKWHGISGKLSEFSEIWRHFDRRKNMSLLEGRENPLDGQLRPGWKPHHASWLTEIYKFKGGFF